MYKCLIESYRWIYEILSRRGRIEKEGERKRKRDRHVYNRGAGKELGKAYREVHFDTPPYSIYTHESQLNKEIEARRSEKPDTVDESVYICYTCVPCFCRECEYPHERLKKKKKRNNNTSHMPPSPPYRTVSRKTCTNASRCKPRAKRRCPLILVVFSVYVCVLRRCVVPLFPARKRNTWFPSPSSRETRNRGWEKWQKERERERQCAR